MKISVPLVANSVKAARQELVALSNATLQEEVDSINGILPKPYWTVTNKDNTSSLEASYTLRNYMKTWEFLNSVAGSAHDLKHHPTITTTYNKVHILLTTHDVGNQITHLDTKLATAIHSSYASDFFKKSPVSSISKSAFTMNRAFKIIDELTKR